MTGGVGVVGDFVCDCFYKLDTVPEISAWALPPQETGTPYNLEKASCLTRKRDCRPKQGKELDYQTLTLEEIEAIQRKASYLTEEKHNVFMWTIDKYLHKAEQMMEKMGYTLHARMIWDKESGICPAFTVRFSHEYLLWFYRKGKILMPCKEAQGKFATVLRERGTQHSRKPKCAYEMLDTMFPGVKKLELFARCEYKDWDCWGNQTDYFKKIGG